MLSANTVLINANNQPPGFRRFKQHPSTKTLRQATNNPQIINNQPNPSAAASYGGNSQMANTVGTPVKPAVNQIYR